MKISQLVEFRDDLLFTGAVQVSWLEEDPVKAKEAATHFIFHGPSYHGFDPTLIAERGIADTASLTKEVLAALSGERKDDPFLMAIAGYGSGKSHLALTLAYLLSNPDFQEAQTILSNLRRADEDIAAECADYLRYIGKPYLVVALNGMRDFDLTNEIVRQILKRVEEAGLDTEPLEALRPRFKIAETFVKSFFEHLTAEFEEQFGAVAMDEIIERLRVQDEDVFKRVSKIYEKKMGAPIKAVGQESLHDFIRVTCESYCGPDKHFAGLLIIFDEFGRYMEFAVAKAHVAGSGALQQLFEAIQTNEERSYLLCFVQFELKVYQSRVALEKQDELTRYVTRYDAVKKVRLTTNLETLIANLIEKKDPGSIAEQIEKNKTYYDYLFGWMQKVLPELSNHRLWRDPSTFFQVIQKGCWPLHPLSVWMYFRLASIGRSLQQRSALSLLGESFDAIAGKGLPDGRLIYPTDLCSQALIEEFKTSEERGLQGAVAYTFEKVLEKFQYQLTREQLNVLKSILIFSKIGIKVDDRTEYQEAIVHCTGMNQETVDDALRALEYEYGVIGWSDWLHQYQIIGDAVPRAAFLQVLETEKAKITSHQRAELFGQRLDQWCEKGKEYENCDFAMEKNISTTDFNYQVVFTGLDLLKPQIKQAFENWREARQVNEKKGQLIFCYVGPESDLRAVEELVTATFHQNLGDNNEYGAPVVVTLLFDDEGKLGDLLAEHFVLEKMSGEQEYGKFSNYIQTQLENVKNALSDQFDQLVKQGKVITAAPKYKPEGTRFRRQLTRLFEAVYPEAIPFPFDGFSTTRGNAAEDAQEFTKQLILGTLDKMWIANRSPRQVNRAHALFEESWQIFNKEGRLRTKPANERVNKLISLLEELLNEASEGHLEGFNLGSTVRMLCAPPYGLNMASAGLILVLFLALHSDTVEMIYEGKQIAREVWLQNAFSGRFLSLSVLDKTYLIRISEEQRSEWKYLLEEWEIEQTYQGKVKYWKQAKELKERVPLPQSEYWHYQSLEDDAKRAMLKLRDFEEFMNSVVERAERAIEREEMGELALQTAALVNKWNHMELEAGRWTAEQVKEIEDYIARYRVIVEQRFRKWLMGYSIRRIEDLASFKFRLKKIISALRTLEMDDLKDTAGEHLHNVEKNARELEEMNRVLDEVNRLNNTPITLQSTIVSVKGHIEYCKQLYQRLVKASKKGIIKKPELAEARKKLLEFKAACESHIDKNRERASRIFGVSNISSLYELEVLQAEVNSLIKVFEGDEKNVEDLILVKKQLEMIGEHWQMLDNNGLDTPEFVRLWKIYKQSTEDSMGDEETPLDNDALYISMFKAILEKRRKMAEQWMQANTKFSKGIEEFSAEECTTAIRRLQQSPAVLSDKQRKIVNNIIQQCEARLDELEVDGLVARFMQLSPQNRQVFLRKISMLIGKNSLVPESSHS